ncbi:MAG: hypothetical protein A2021_01525 [Elusimicrobia bacterium GWF2_52_66]|nr:MAG: hypothetical protein A2X33_02555 [Elusimicrobia bacterium GWA2_51_34]OGR87001.1 MAG: hypothetical protein A2021_01525 [Elusimicrobia bacterium GWF2_52_66]
MRVLYDHQIFSEHRYGGISRYYFSLLTRLAASGVAEVFLSSKFSNNMHLAASDLAKGSFFCGGLQFRGKVRLMNFLNERYSRARIAAGDYDIFHPTYFNPYFLDSIGAKPFVLTVYDMIHELFPANFRSTRERQTAEWKRMLAARAAKIITISETTKADIVRLYGINPEKVEAIHLANSLDQAEASPPENFRLPAGYLLFVGERAGYKNFGPMARALAPLMAIEAINLVCVGGGKFTSAEQEMLAGLGLKNIVQCPAGDRELAWFYSNAAALVVPSLYEGFGIPVLEAFACGCPVVLANTGSLPEVGGDAALYFDPVDDNSIRETVLRLVTGVSLREELKRKGRERLKQFSWDLTAEKTLKVYKAII